VTRPGRALVGLALSELALTLLVPACGAATPRGPAPPTNEARTSPGQTSDRDLDRIPDAPEGGPQAAEDEDGFEEADGCYDADNDGDDVVDIRDLCPCDAEDGDGWQDENGCPDPDNDGDRYQDACDLCPNEPETYNGICDEDGCPDRSGICIEDSRIVIVETIGFARGSARIAPESMPIVEALAATLLGNPQIERVALVGHATPRERGASTLGLRRAEAVRDAVVARGVASERLEPQAAPPTEAMAGAPRDGREVGFVLLRVNGEDWTEGEPPPRPGAWGGCGAPRTCPAVPACSVPPPTRSACRAPRGGPSPQPSPAGGRGGSRR